MAETSEGRTEDLAATEDAIMIDTSGNNSHDTSSTPTADAALPTNSQLGAQTQPSTTNLRVTTTSVDARRIAQRMLRHEFARPKPNDSQRSAESGSPQVQTGVQLDIEAAGMLGTEDLSNNEGNDASILDADEDDPETSPAIRAVNPFLEDEDEDEDSDSEPEPRQSLRSTASDSALGDGANEADSDTDVEYSLIARAPSSSHGYASLRSSGSTSAATTPPSPTAGARRLHRSMTAASRRFRSAAPNLHDVEGLVGRLLSGEVDEGIFVKMEDEASSMSRLSRSPACNRDDGTTDEEGDQEFQHEAFQILEAIFDKKVRTNNVKHKDKVDFGLIRTGYYRSFRKRKAEGLVDTKELSAAKKNALHRESQLSEIQHRMHHRSINARQSAELDRAGAERKPSNPRPRERLRTPDMRAPHRELEKYRPLRDDARPGRLDRDWNPTGKELPGPHADHAPDPNRDALGDESEQDEEHEDVRPAKKARRKRGEMPPPEATGLGNLQGDIFRSARDAANSPQTQGCPEPTFASPVHEEALTRIMVFGMEKGPSVKKKKKSDDAIKIEKSSVNFTRGNKPKRLENGMFELPRMKTTLHPYQMLGVSWLRWREWSATEPFGGFLADQMGLGKTIMMLACILDGRPDRLALKRGHRATLVVAPKSIIKQWQREIDLHCHEKWVGKVTVYRTNLKADKDTVLGTLGVHDIILTTYHDVFRSYPRAKYPAHLKSDEEKQAWWAGHLQREGGPLHQIHFHRVVFDECQKLKNPCSKFFEAAASIKATRRWLLSGTPIIDRPKELYPYYRLLNKDYTGDLRTFTANFLSKNPKAQARMNLSLNNMILRRTHDDRLDGKRLFHLPSAQEIQLLCSFSKFEYAVYLAIVEKYEVLMDKAVEANQPVLPIFGCLNAAVQKLAVHPILAQEEIAELPKSTREKLFKLYEQEKKKNAKDELRRLQVHYGIDPACGIGRTYGEYPSFDRYKRALESGQSEARPVSAEPCCVCGQTPATARSYPCDHNYCAACADDLRDSADNDGILGACADCDTSISRFDDVHEDSATLNNVQERRKGKKKQIPAEHYWPKQRGLPWPSEKCKALKLKVLEWIWKKPNVKVVIFTHYLGMIDHLKKLCDCERWGYTELKGELLEDARAKHIQDFQRDDSIRILLSTTQTGGTGLNLDCATRVILLEPWWNDSWDQQAISRVWRHGQTKEVECVRIYMKGSIDTQKTALRARKAKAIGRMALKGGATAEYHRYVELFKPAENAVEKKQGGFMLVGEQIPEKSLPSTDDDDLDSSDTESEAEESD